MASSAGLGIGTDWERALGQALATIPRGPHDLVFLFASHEYREDYAAILAAIEAELRPRVMLGCSGQGIIGREREVEAEPSVSVLALDLPGAQLRPIRVYPANLDTTVTPGAWHGRTGVAPGDVNAWLLFADPFTMDCERLIELMSEAYPGLPLIGGMASGHPGRRNTDLFLDGHVVDDGAVAVAVGGDWTLQPVVSQGAAPIGEPWTITAVERNVIATIGGRPALETLVETVRDLAPEMQRRVSQNLLIGLAMDEYRDEFRRGDFLIRNLMGVDQENGAIAVNAFPRVGQTLQFQVRDAAAASEELDEMLDRTTRDLGQSRPVGAVVCSCNGRGMGLFGPVNHDPAAVAEHFGDLPVAGFFCNGEIGPVGGRNFLHGFTASIAFFVPVLSAGSG